MAEEQNENLYRGSIPNLNYFLAGLGIGTVVSLLLAPKSGQETRQYITDKTREANEYARQTAQDLKLRAGEAVEQGKDTIAQASDNIATAIQVGRETYIREKAKAQAG